jgi:flagellin
MLLRLKQLATQGYDGSLSTSQKLNIVQEMKDLNNEINATAQRTAFNGISLLVSGSSIDANNSDIKVGQQLINTAVTVDTATAGTLGTVLGVTPGASAGLDFSASGVTGGTELTGIELDPALAPKLGGLSFTFTASGNNLTMTGTQDGLAKSQTITVRDTEFDSVRAITDTQQLNFDQFGVKFNLSTLTVANAATLGSRIATAFTTAANNPLTFNGKMGEITDVKLSGVAPGTFSLSSTAGSGVLKLSGSINGQAVTQELTLTTNAANATQTINFSSFGIQFDVKSYQSQTAAEIADQLVLLNNGSPSTAGQIVIAQGANSALKFQAGPNSDAFIQIDTINIQTGTTGNTAGQYDEMRNVGTRITSSAAGNLGTLGNLDSIEKWQTAFKNAAAAVDDALEFISTERAIYGSQMNRLSYVSTNLQAQSTNLQNSRSAIMDTDFAAETAKLTKGQIMQQAATAMLAQANQMPNVILSLLK